MKKILIYTPIVLSMLVLGAHFMRYANGSVIPIAVAAALLGLLFVRQPWVARLMQSVLVVGTVEWVITLFNLACSCRALKRSRKAGASSTQSTRQ